MNLIFFSYFFRIFQREVVATKDPEYVTDFA